MNTNTITVPKAEFDFSTFEKARAFIENYAAQTNIVVILVKTTKNKDGSSYRQAFFACKKQGQYNGKKEDAYTTKWTGCLFVVGLNYCKRIKKFVITKLCSEHNHEINPDSRKFSSNIRKFSLNELGMIGELHDNRLRIKDIYVVLASISSKYVHKHDIYNAISRQCQQKLQGLNEIELLLKTLQNDENIMSSIATQPVYNNERDQDGSFIQAIFWAYRSAVFEFAIAKDVLIIDTTYKTNRFSMPMIVVCSINRFRSTYPLAFALVYSEMKEFYSWVLQQLCKTLTILTGDSNVTMIITDQELALMSSISTVFPNTKHQLCIWYIFRNMRKKLKSIDMDEFIKLTSPASKH
ncbi:28011_t:CDS:2 [Racocetra persica]|uniref:28011_t:CDS:1 n=1 Tax=Racocetra persica TaxID=160502 RepID=A0ACA9KML1_9GLOM|nr:28011_t:CDS:2 [Racocetra persica]